MPKEVEVHSVDQPDTEVEDGAGPRNEPDNEPEAEPEPVVTIAAGEDSMTEGEAVSFTVTAEPAPAADLAVSVTVTETEITLAASESESRTVTITAGQTTATLQVVTDDDEADEPDSTVTATLTVGPGYKLGSPNSAGVTVADNDEPVVDEPVVDEPVVDEPVVTIAADEDSVTEGEAASFTVMADPAPAADLAVSVTVTETETTLAASESGSRTVTITAGQTTATLQVATDDDEADEPGSTVTATLTVGPGYKLGSPNSAVVTVADNDPGVVSPPPKSTVSIANVSPLQVTEGGRVSVTLRASPAPTAGLTGDVMFLDSDDMIGAERWSFRFGAGQVGDVVSYLVREDGANVSRTLTIWLARTTDADSYVAASGTRTVTINDGDDD